MLHVVEEAMIGHEPSTFPRRILLATIGLAPQILTETLYALAVCGDPPFVPNEIHVITTEEGRHRLTLALLDASTAKLAEFAREFDLAQLESALTPERVHVIHDPAGSTLSDISSGSDSEAAADQIVSLVRTLTSDDNAAVHVSIAGGRKTMGFLLGYALSLFGRTQDRLSHVLVDQPFENHPQFFYPPRNPRVLYAKDDRPINTADAKLSLAEIPFVRLRYGLPQELVEGEASFSETVALAQKSIAEPQLVIDPKNRVIACHGVRLSLQPLQFAIYAWLARRRLEGLDGDGAVHWSTADPRELLNEYRSLPDLPPGAEQEQEERWKDGIPSETLEQNKARINTELTHALGRFSEPYLIHHRGQLSGTRYVRIGLKLAPETISFGPLPPEPPPEA